MNVNELKKILAKARGTDLVVFQIKNDTCSYSIDRAWTGNGNKKKKNNVVGFFYLESELEEK